ncbi:MAG TPA: alpha/beta hydrolase [Pseudonocardiaceae bacterium]
MTVSTPTGTTRTVALRAGLTITITEYGSPTDGAGALVLHGGAGPRSVAGLAAALTTYGYVAVPTHPGFDGTPRPEWADSVADLATGYLDLLDELGLTGVTVYGSSIGGWIATEMAVRDNHKAIEALVLLGGTGIEPKPPLEIGDPAKLGPVRTGELAFHNPALRLDPSTLTDAQRAVMAENARVQAIYAPGSNDPKLRGRLHRVAVPVLVLGGEQDGIVPLDYERDLADSFPKAMFRAIPAAAHFPHIEQPELVLGAIAEFRAGAGR